MGLTLVPTAQDWRNVHKGETLWVVGSGASVNRVSREFFNDKICIAVNLVGIVYGLQEFYTVTHYHVDAITVATKRPDLPVITPIQDLGGINQSPGLPTQSNVYRFVTGPQMYSAFNAERDWPMNEHELVIGPTSLHMAMHFAAYLGASTIVLVGADCGVLDDESNFNGYSPGDNPYGIWEANLGSVANQLRARGHNVHSLNPFVNFALEGVTFRGPTVQIN